MRWFVLLLMVTLSAQGSFADVATGQMSPERKVDVVIIGAGLSGLTAAYELKKAGLSYQVLEAGPRVGGRVRTVRYEFAGETTSVDSGMEEYWESNPAVEYLKELNLKRRSDVAVSSLVVQNSLVLLGGEDPEAFQKKLFNAKELAALARFKRELKPILAELHKFQQDNLGHAKLAPKLLKLKDVSFSEWVTKTKKLPARVADWIRVSIECEAGTEWNQISALEGIAEFHIFVGDKGSGELSYRVIDGNDAFTDALAKAAGNILTNRRVTKVVRTQTSQGERSHVVALDLAKNRQEMYEARYVITTIPIYRLNEIQFEPPLSAKKWQGISSQRYGSYFKAHVFVPRTAERFWTKNGNSTLPILSDSELGVIYDGNPDHEGQVKVLSLLVSGARAEGFNFASLDSVREILKARFEKLWPGFSKEIQNIEFYRYHPRAVAAWPVGRSRFDELSQEIRRPENGVHIAGDYTESSHSDGAFISALRAVKQIKSAQEATPQKAEQ